MTLARKFKRLIEVVSFMEEKSKAVLNIQVKKTQRNTNMNKENKHK